MATLSESVRQVLGEKYTTKKEWEGSADDKKVDSITGYKEDSKKDDELDDAAVKAVDDGEKKQKEEDEKKVEESVEPLEEISKGLAGAYIKKAHRDGAKMEALHKDSKRYSDRRDEAFYKRKSENRTAGIDRATDKLTKEEIEPLEEISKGKVVSYLKKATESQPQLGTKERPLNGVPRERRSEEENKSLDKAGRRDNSIALGIRKLTGHVGRAKVSATNEGTEMDESTLIALAAEQNPLDFMEAFNELMTERVSTIVEELREEVGQTMFTEISKNKLREYGSAAIVDKKKAREEGDTKRADKRSKGVELARAKVYHTQYEKSPLKAKIPAKDKE